MSPWLIVVAPLVAVCFPLTIPVLLVIAAWQLTDGGREVRAALTQRRRERTPLPELLAADLARRGPLPVDDPEDEPPLAVLVDDATRRLAGTCPGCMGALTRGPGSGWRHTKPDDGCPDTPTLTPLEGEHL